MFFHLILTFLWFKPVSSATKEKVQAFINSSVISGSRFHHVSYSPDPFSEAWIEDPVSRKQYLVRETSTLDHDVNLKLCETFETDAKLPEPKTSDNNAFLSSLKADMFVLGMRDVEMNGNWLYDSWRRPVVLNNWASSDQQSGDCAVMLQNTFRDRSDHDPQSWLSIPCSSNQEYDSKPKSLVCQRRKGL